MHYLVLEYFIVINVIVCDVFCSIDWDGNVVRDSGWETF